MSKQSLLAAALLLGTLLAAGTAQGDRPDAGTCNAQLRPPLGAHIAGSFPVFSMSDARGASLRRADDGTMARTHTVALTDGFPHFVLVLDADLAEGEWELVLDDSTAWCTDDFVPHVFHVGPPVEGSQLGTLSVERFVVRDIGAGLQPVLHVRVTLPAGHEALGEMTDVTLASSVDGVGVGRRLWLNLATTGVYPVPIGCPRGEERSVEIAVQAMVGEEILEGFATSNTFAVRCDDATDGPEVEPDPVPSREDSGSDAGIDAGTDHVVFGSGCNATSGTPSSPSSLLWLLVGAAALTAPRRAMRASQQAR